MVGAALAYQVASRQCQSQGVSSESLSSHLSAENLFPKLRSEVAEVKPERRAV